ncbi:MAG: cobalt ECF transporter T component CbiQ [Cyanobacteria bacterium P01_D01_bin.105]
MSLASIDSYVGGRSPLHLWTPRLKLLGLGCLMFAFAAIRHLPLVVPMLGTTALIYALSGLPLAFLLKRLRYPGLFILTVVLILPLTSGETVLWQWGLFALRQEGIMAMTLVVSRFVCILTLGFVLLGTTPFVTLLRSLRALGLPTLLTDMTLLTYRYLFETADMLSTMQRSMRLRGFGHTKRRWLSLQKQDLQRLVGLLATLLIRSYERAERIYTAMRLRGYGRLKHPPARANVDAASACLTGAAVAIAIIFVAIEVAIQ